MIYVSNMNVGGAERVVMTLANQLNKDMEIVVLTDSVGTHEFQGETDFRRINLNYQVAASKIMRAFRKIGYLYRMRQVCLEEKPDVIVSFSIECGLRIQTALKGTSIKQVITVRSNPALDYQNESQIAAITRKLSGIQGFVFQTQQQRDFFPKEIREKSCIIFNPLNEEFLQKKEQVQKQKEVITVGRLTRSKDHKMLLRAYNKLAEEFPEYRFLIYGNGELCTETEEYRQTLKHKDQIYLCGETQNVKECLNKAEVFVLSSSNEGMPNSLMEAMAMEMPVVSTDCPCGGPAALIQEGINGFLVPVGDDEMLAQKISVLLRNQKLAFTIGKNAGKIKELCSGEYIAKQWIDYLRKIIEHETK